MKKIILCAMALIAFSFANAQYKNSDDIPQPEAIKTKAGTFTKPAKGTTIFEINLTPDLTGNGIFTLPEVANSLGMYGIKVRKFHTDTRACRWGANLNVRDNGIPNDKTDVAVGLSAGVEYHRAGAERLSTYWGYDVNLAYTTSDASNTGHSTTKCGAGASIFTGFDYYIMPKIYLGTEISYAAAVTSTDPPYGSTRTRFELAPSIIPSLRLGWQF